MSQILRNLQEQLHAHNWVNWILTKNPKPSINHFKTPKYETLVTKPDVPLNQALEELSQKLYNIYSEKSNPSPSDLFIYYRYLEYHGVVIAIDGSITILTNRDDGQTVYTNFERDIYLIKELNAFKEAGGVVQGEWWSNILSASKEDEFICFLQRRNFKKYNELFPNSPNTGLLDFEVFMRDLEHFKQRIVDEESFPHHLIHKTNEGLHISANLVPEISKLAVDWLHRSTKNEHKKKPNKELSYVRELIGNMEIEAQGKDPVLFLLYRTASLFKENKRSVESVHSSTSYILNRFWYLPVDGVTLEKNRGNYRWILSSPGSTPAQKLYEEFKNNRSWNSADWASWHYFLERKLKEKETGPVPTFGDTRSYLKFLRFQPQHPETETYLLSLQEGWGVPPLWKAFKEVDAWFEESNKDSKK